jgi:hypothetical protein
VVPAHGVPVRLRPLLQNTLALDGFCAAIAVALSTTPSQSSSTPLQVSALVGNFGHCSQPG